MASTNLTRYTTKSGPRHPMRVSLAPAANQYFAKGTIVTRNAAGAAVSPSSADVSGNPAMGTSNQSYDCRTAVVSPPDQIEIDPGIQGNFPYTGTAPVVGQHLYVVDNQTLSVDSLGGLRGFAGVCTSVDTTNTVCYCLMGPEVAANAAGKLGMLWIPLNAFRIASSGATVAAFAAGSTDGFDSTAESGGIRWNDDVFTKFSTSVPYPLDLNGAAPAVLHAVGYRVGAVDVTAALDFEVFVQEIGAAFSADTDLGGDSTAFDAATTVVDEVTLTLAAANLADNAPAVLHITMVPTAALDDDDLVVTGLWLAYTKK